MGEGGLGQLEGFGDLVEGGIVGEAKVSTEEVNEDSRRRHDEEVCGTA